MSRTLHDALAPVRRRRVAIALALALPPLAVLLALAWLRLDGMAAAVVLAAAVLTAFAWAARERRRIDLRWCARALNAADTRFDDSAELLLAEPAQLQPLAQLQQERLRQRLQQQLPELRPAWPRAALAGSCALAAVLALLGLWRAPPTVATTTAATATTAPAAQPVVLVAHSLTIEPPRYTGLPASRQDALDARVPEGALLRWQLRFAPQPRAVKLRFHDGRELALSAAGEDWTAQYKLDNAALYRIEIDADTALAQERRYRLDTIADQPPTIRVEAPDKTLSLREQGQDSWAFDIRASDDYGLGEASLEIVRAQGSGENIAVKRETLRLRGEGDARERRYRHRIELAPLGLAPGDELIVRLDVADQREPQPQHSRSASYILRLPPPPGDDSVGMDGLVQKTLPAYFRSQRQLIIDTEALIAEKPKLAEDAFVARSDALGVEQKILRLRYGQFLGEEFESGGHAPPPPADKHDDHDDHGEGEAHAGEDKPAAAPAAHDHAQPAAPKRFGDAGNVLAEFGHTHDHTEAATLLDPETKKILKAALEQMWQSELELRSGRPQQALPHEYKALEQIKLVQQSTRIYLARVGLELPPVDEARRLSGERTGLRDSTNAAQPAKAADAELDALWQALQRGEPPQWPRFDAWLRDSGLGSEQALDLAAVADSWRRDAACTHCRDDLRARLWPLLPRASAASAGREQPDRRGRAYLQALQQGAQP